MKRYRTLLWAGVLLFAGCAHHQVNRPLEKFDDSAGYRFRNLPASAANTDRLFVILTFSGGGTRAAALSYGVLKELANTTITIDGQSKRLLDEVDVIASVSGGSFTAAYYALFGKRIFDDFESRFLKKNIQAALAWQVAKPWNWARLVSPYFDRIDLAAEYYDRNIFDHATFDALVGQKNRPYIIINATDMVLGSRFEFTQDQFDRLYSDLSGFPISRAVAASSAFPFLLSPITLNNYEKKPDYKEAAWIKNALHDREVEPRRYYAALEQKAYEDYQERPFMHVLDGGISDNIGLRGPLHSVLTMDSPWSLVDLVNSGKIDKVVAIVVNARTDSSSKLKMNKNESAPRLWKVAETVATAPMDAYSMETVELMRRSFDEWRQDVQSRQDCEEVLKEKCPGATLPGKLKEVKFYPIEVRFDDIQDKDRQRYFKDLPTSFALPSEDVDKVRDVGGELLRKARAFQELLRDLK